MGKCWCDAEVIALTPALSQAWEREQENLLSFPAPLLPALREAARAPRVSRSRSVSQRGFSETRQGLGDEGNQPLQPISKSPTFATDTNLHTSHLAGAIARDRQIQLVNLA
jgi:hypothetical protein